MLFISALFPRPPFLFPNLVYGDPIAGRRMCKHNLLQLECDATPLLPLGRFSEIGPQAECIADMNTTVGYDYEYQARMQSISGLEPPGAQGEYCLGSSLVNCTAPGGFGSVRPIPLPFNSRVCLLSLIWRLVFCPIKQRLASDLSQGLRRCLHSPLRFDLAVWMAVVSVRGTSTDWLKNHF